MRVVGWAAAVVLVSGCTSETKPAPPAPSPADEAPRATAPKDLATTIAQLAVDPRSGKPRAVQSGKDTSGLDVTAYTYELPGASGPVLLDVLDKDPKAWIAIVPGGPAAVAPAGGLVQRVESKGGSRWTEVKEGPLAGAFLEQKKGAAAVEVKSVAWVLAHDDHEIGGWLCHEGRVPGVVPKKPADMEAQCQAAVKAKLYYKSGMVFSAGLSGPHEIRTFANCTQSWNGWAESDTPWGRHKRDFSCNWDPRRERLTVLVQGP